MSDDAALIATPVGFTERVLGLSLYWWQAKFLSFFESLTHLVKASLCTPNGAGKSERVVASLVLWWLAVHVRGRVVITSKDSKQLDHQIWPALEAHKAKFPSYRFIEREIHTPSGGFAIGFTTDEPGRAEGWHKVDNIDGPLLIICDEAKSIPLSIFMAFDRCTFSAIAYTSSPGEDEGVFYDSQTRMAEAEGRPSPPAFKTVRVGLKDCPHIPKERIDNIIATYGPDHPYTRSTLHGEFMPRDASAMYIVPKSAVDACMDPALQPDYVHGGRLGTCDFAAGRNENVFTLLEGNRITQHCWKDRDPMRAIGQFIAYFVQYGLSPSQIYGDEGGMGIPIIARFRELNWPIIPVRNDDTAMEPTKYENKGAEVWYKGSLRIQRGVILPNDPILKAQLTNRKIRPTSSEILGAETKKEMAKRNVESPDRADGCLMALAAEETLATVLFEETGLQRLEAMAKLAKPERGAVTVVGNSVSYENGAQNPWLTVWERPMPGRSYICVVNPARQSEPTKDHSILVLRAPLVGNDGAISNPRLAARVRIPLRVDAGPLAKLVASVTRFYGRCFTVPIVNDRGDVIEALLASGIHIYTRENLETLRHGARRSEAIQYGWDGNDYNRSTWIGALMESVRERQIDLEDMETVMQLYRLSVANSGEMRDAEALGVGLRCIGSATTYASPANVFDNLLTRPNRHELTTTMFG